MSVAPWEMVPKPKGGRPNAQSLSGLTARQRVFVSEYLVDMNGTAAAIRAGYSSDSAEVQAHWLLSNAKVRSAVDAAMAYREKRTLITQDRVLNETALLAFSDVTNYVIGDDGQVSLAPHAPKGAQRAISTIKKRITTTKDGDVVREVELKLWDKVKPLHMAGQHVNLFTEKMDEERVNREVEKRLREILAAAQSEAQKALDVTPVQALPASSE